MSPRARAALTRSCILLLALLTAACAAPTARTQSPQTAINCAKLAHLGVTQCPPATPPLAHPKLTNDTHGQVSNKQFTRLVKAFLRTEAYEVFALRSNEASLLKAGILSTRQGETLSYGSDLMDLTEARSEGGRLGGAYGSISALRLVVVTTDLRENLSQNGYVPTHLAWVATYRAPESGFIIAGSRFSVLYSASAHASPVSDVEIGTMRAHTPLGLIWQYHGDIRCNFSASSQAVCDS